MNKPLSKREALEICIKMWDFLADNPYYSKEEVISTLNLPTNMTENCAACEYDAQQGMEDCTNCPVWTGELGCFYTNKASQASYREWSHSKVGSEKRVHEARKIANLARRRLKELNTREQKTGQQEN